MHRSRTRAPVAAVVSSLLLVAAGVLVTSVLLTAPVPSAAETPTESERIRELENVVRALRDEVTELRESSRSSHAEVADVQRGLEDVEGLLSRVELGGYGSLRWENSSLDELANTFTLRRFVLTTSAEISSRLRFYSELEYERFRKLELERRTAPSEGGLAVVQEIEGTDGSEIALEQAWLEFDLSDRLSARLGGLLVPLGRFNRDHDDNRWNLARRTLVDTGVPVLPVSSAWDELGAGLVGRFPVGEGQVGFELYVLNGTTLDAEVELKAQTRDPSRDKLEAEAEFTRQTGSFSTDFNEDKSVAARVAWQPAVGGELGLSFYRGRYTPDYLSDRHVSSLAADGLARLGGLELEGEYVYTRFDSPRSVAESLARVAIEQATETGDPTLETEVAFDIQNIAEALHGYWIELRYPFWPSFLSGSLLASGFEDPRLVPVARWEQVFFRDRLASLDFTGRALTSYVTEDRRLNRLTLGLAYRPMPLVGFTIAYEYLFADGDSLASLASFLPSTVDDERAHVVSFGATFGF